MVLGCSWEVPDGFRMVADGFGWFRLVYCDTRNIFSYRNMNFVKSLTKLDIDSKCALLQNIVRKDLKSLNPAR